MVVFHSRTYSRSTLMALLTFQAWSQPLLGQTTEGLLLDRVFPVAFGKVGPVRELSDGRVMVADPLGRVLVIIDFESGAADTLGRSGAGPEEYGQPDAVFSLEGDTTLLVDLGNARLTTIAPDGTFLHTLPMGQQTSTGGMVVTLPRGVDTAGRLYFRSEQQPQGYSPDSTPLLRFDPVTRSLDTLALLKVPKLGPPPLPGGGDLRGTALEPEDDWAVGPDGRVAIVRSENYSVTWVYPGGQTVPGPPNDFRPVPVGRAERELWLEENAVSQVAMRADETGTVRMLRGEAGTSRSAVNAYEWPPVFSALKPGRSQVSPTGEVWVERFVSAGEEPLIDRFDGHGRKVGDQRLPMGRRVAGFGRDAVFLVLTDEVGLQWIERYRLRESGGGIS
jgi:hypothetical protein